MQLYLETEFTGSRDGRALGFLSALEVSFASRSSLRKFLKLS